MALPWMESIRTLGASASTSASTTGQAPLRFGVLFAETDFTVANGKPRAREENMELGRVLESLIPHRNHMHFIRGLYNAQALKGNIHSSQTGNLLSGAPLAGRYSLGYERGSNDRTARWQIHQDPRSRARLRKIQPIGSQIIPCSTVHISWTSPTSPTPWSFTLPWLLIACSRIRQPRRPKCARCHMGGSQGIASADQHSRPAKTRRTHAFGARGGRTYRERRVQGHTAGMAPHAGKTRSTSPPKNSSGHR